MKNTIILLYESWLNKTGNITGNDEIDEWIDKNKLIITDSEEAIKEIIQRLVTQNIKPM